MQKYASVISLLLLSFFAVRELIGPGFVPTHDGEYHIVRLWQFEKNITDMNILPLWAPDLSEGYGVPLFEFFYPLPGYVGVLFRFFGFSYIASFQWALATGLIFSSFSFYVWCRVFFRRFASVVGSIAYTIAPYHTLDVSIRGSVGEVWALAIAPLVFLFITSLVSARRHSLSLAAVSVFASLLLISHNIVGLFLFAMAFVYGFLLCFFEKKSYRSLGIGFLFSLFLSAFFWLPVIFESKYVAGLTIMNYADHFPALFQLIVPSWGSGFSVAGVSDQMSFQLGLVHIFGICVGLWYAVRRKKYVIGMFVLIWFFCTFLMLESSAFLWKAVYPLQIMQFPWRILSVSILLSSFVVAYVSDINKRLAFVLLAASVLLYMPYTRPVVYEPREDRLYTESEQWRTGTTTWGNTFSIKGFSAPKPSVQEEFSIIEGHGEVLQSIRGTTMSKATVQLEEDGVIEVHRAYFPGWNALLNNKKVPIGTAANGIIRLEVPSGYHSIMVQFGHTPVRKASYAVSLAAGVFLIGSVFIHWYENSRRHIAA